MTNDLRTVFDTGVLVSAVLLPQSVPGQAFDQAILTGRILLSEATVEELDDVLRRPKFDRYISERHRLEFLAALVNQAEIVPITQRVTACRDARDDKFLELAVSGNASHVISGDADLLHLNPFQGISVVSPADFLKLLKPT